MQLNKEIKWEWNAVRNGSVYDCRLCIPTRPKNVWNSCSKDCKHVPPELANIKLDHNEILGEALFDLALLN